MMTEFEKGVIELLKSGITGKKAVLPESFDWEAAYTLAVEHQIVSILYFGIVNSELSVPEPVRSNLKIRLYQTIAVNETQLYELSILCKAFDEHHIDYMPLKGMIFKNIYPKPEMRQMRDADILIKQNQYDQIVPILQEQGFVFLKESTNDYTWIKNAVCIEFHWYLLSPDHSDYFCAFGEGWQFALPSDPNHFCYEMKQEDFYVFAVLHFAKHYRRSGIGIRHLTDIWLYLEQNPNMDMEYVDLQLEKVHLAAFHNNILKTVAVWFNDWKSDDVTALITQKIFSSGSYGTLESAHKSALLKQSKVEKVKTGRWKLFLRAAFPDLKSMQKLYPFLKKAPFLLPFFWIFRLFHALFFKRSKTNAHYMEIKALTNESILDYENELLAVGLDYRTEDD